MEYIWTNGFNDDIYEHHCQCGTKLTGTREYLAKVPFCFLCCKLHGQRKPCPGCVTETKEEQLADRREREAGYRIDRHEQVRAKEKRRKNRVKAAGGSYLIDYDKMYEAQEGRCAYCKRTIAELNSTRYTKLTADHVIPVSKGGTNDPANLVLCCQPCNASKSDKFLEDWKSSKYFKANCYNK